MSYEDRHKALAISQTAGANSQTFMLAAILAKGKKILSIGHNTSKTHPKSYHPYKSIHAELSAILKANDDLEGSTIYVARTSRNIRKIGMAKPCRYCMEMLMDVGVQKVWYTTSCGSWKEILLSKF